MSRTKRLAALEGQLVQQERLAELEDLKQVAEIARAKLLGAIDRYKRGEPIPEPAIRHDSQAHRWLQARFIETRERLLRFGAIRERMP